MMDDTGIDEFSVWDTKRYIKGDGAYFGSTRNMVYELNSMHKLMGCLKTQWALPTTGDRGRTVGYDLSLRDATRNAGILHCDIVLQQEVSLTRSEIEVESSLGQFVRTSRRTANSTSEQMRQQTITRQGGLCQRKQVRIRLRCFWKHSSLVHAFEERQPSSPSHAVGNRAVPEASPK